MKGRVLEVLGEQASIATDIALVDLGAAQLAIARAASARTPRARARAWERAVHLLRSAQLELAQAELAAIARAHEALMAAPQNVANGNQGWGEEKHGA